MASSSLCFWFSVPLPVPSILHMQTPNLPGYECAHRPLPSAPVPCLVTQALQIRSLHPLSSLPCSPHSPRAQSPGSPNPTTSGSLSPRGLYPLHTHSWPIFRTQCRGWEPLLGKPQPPGLPAIVLCITWYCHVSLSCCSYQAPHSMPHSQGSALIMVGPYSRHSAWSGTR